MGFPRNTVTEDPRLLVTVRSQFMQGRRRRHAHELATKRPTLNEPSLVNHRLPSGPTVIPKGPLPVPKPLRRLPLVVICPTRPSSCIVNQRLPLGPVVMP